jgi:hypothetical protein
LSYARRYSIASVCGIFQDDGTEDDGHLASSPPGRPPTAAQPLPRVETKERKGAEAAPNAGHKPNSKPSGEVNHGPDLAGSDLPF